MACMGDDQIATTRERGFGMRVILLDGDNSHSLPIAAELVTELGVEIIGAVQSPRAHLARSRHVSRTFQVPAPDAEGFASRVMDVARMARATVILPIGYGSFRAMLNARDTLPPTVGLVAPPADAFDIAASKLATADLARQCGVRIPSAVGRVENGAATSLPSEYPVFAKSSVERGGPSTAILRSEAELQDFDWSSLGGDAVLQEVIDGDAFTYGHCGYFEDGHPVVEVQHIELHSVPRRGGSATRIRTFENAELGDAARSLMRALHWTGPAQVEFKKARDGGWVLMEINPKFWASYAHTSRAGGLIAATAIARAAGLGDPDRAERSSDREIEMVFPFRELQHVMRSRTPAEILRAARNVLCPPTPPNFTPRDLLANIPLPRPHDISAP